MILGSKLESLDFLPTITPSDKSLDIDLILLQEFVMYIFAQYINKGAVLSYCHDKGERKGLGRLIRLGSVYNKDQKLDPNFRNGIFHYV